jgi:hypothetical protein
MNWRCACASAGCVLVAVRRLKLLHLHGLCMWCVHASTLLCLKFFWCCQYHLLNPVGGSHQLNSCSFALHSNDYGGIAVVVVQRLVAVRSTTGAMQLRFAGKERA